MAEIHVASSSATGFETRMEIAVSISPVCLLCDLEQSDGGKTRTKSRKKNGVMG